MTLQELEIYGGITIGAQDSARYLAAIRRARVTLESLLGYTLDDEHIADSEWEGTGLEYEDIAYRVYNFNPADNHLRIDPATHVESVYMLYGGTTEPDLLEDPEDYQTFLSQGWYRYLDVRNTICHRLLSYSGIKIAVNADWIGLSGFPEDLMSLWASFAVDFGDPSRDLKSETLGPHRYDRFGSDKKLDLQLSEGNKEILRRFAGPKGIILTMPVQ